MGICDAVSDDHTPSLLERERYCHNAGQGCPVREAFEESGARLSLSEYLDTWSRPPMSRAKELRDLLA